jgi:hypothetical protein
VRIIKRKRIRGKGNDMTDDTATIEREIEKLSGQIIDVLGDKPLDVIILALIGTLEEAARLDFKNNATPPAVTGLTMNDVLNDLSLELTGEAVDVAARGIAAQEVQDHA